jgi:hypothetical protein
MALLPRSSVIQPGDTIMLRARFTDSGVEVDPDTVPQVSVIQPSGGVALDFTSVGVTRIGVGQYQFNYSVGLFPEIGTWNDVWRCTINGYEVFGQYNFTVFQSQLPAINTDGEVHLSDDPGYNYSQLEICNINNLLKSLRKRLKSSGKAKRTDEYGNIIYKDCDVFETDELVAFIARSLEEFNSIPTFTGFTFSDSDIINQFHGVLVQGATVFALGAQALIERGREYQISDNGISMNNPTISELLNTQYTTELNNWYEKVKLIKVNMRSSPLGLGTLSFTSGSSQFRRLRTLRARQIF